MNTLLLAMLSAAMGAGPGGEKTTTPISVLDANDPGCASAVKALRAKLDVTDVRCQPGLYKTSYPPKLLLTYSLDGHTYIEYAPVTSVRTGAPRKPKDAEAPGKAPQ